MISLAETARVLADNLSARRYGRKVVADLRARAWTELGNAYRVADKPEAAESALRRAAACAKQGTGNLKLMVHIFYRWTAVLREQRALPDCAETLKLIIPYFRLMGDHETLLSALIGLGLVYEQENEPEKAVMVILQTLKRLIPDPESPRLLLLSGISSLAVNLAGAGEFEAAKIALASSRRFFRRAGKLNQFRLCWLEGKVAAGLGKNGSAEAKFNTARLAFRRVGKHYDSALVSLDLALVYARQERHHELIWLVDEMVRTFRALKIARELIASLILLRKSCEKQFSRETLCVQIETIAATLTELSNRVVGEAA
ncbi:MAG TPA: hypothetical protein VLV54_08960 [Thermoanaerobaculia bacterium]|nr:hypothetical protein [Thermoanaerobaculia bacterium]